jgi:succinoglycan biosynthesis protein ExoA
MVISISQQAEHSPARELATTKEFVSVVIPCLNEERFIGKALHNLADQYDPGRYEIIVVDGLSQDRTREVIAEFCRQRPDVAVTLIDNPARRIPAALNLGIEAARGDIIARLDAHAVASPGYIRRSVEVLRQKGVGVVGMPCQVCPGADTLTARAIAMAVSHPFGIGDAKYRLGRGSGQQAVDTVAFACFRKELWRELGGFDEGLSANEDYEFNYRVRKHGETVLLDPVEHCDYFARSSLKDLALQYWRYGRWKARMIRSHPGSIKMRQVVAPIFAASIPLLLLTGLWLRPAWWLLGIELSAYLLLALVFAVKLAVKNNAGLKLALLMPLIFGAIHVSWGTGFWLGLLSPRNANC